MPVEGANHDLGDGDVVIAAITSCTNTSNPSVMMGAGLIARNAVKRGLKVKPWVKTSLAPGSQVVTDYLKLRPGLQAPLDKLGFNLVGYGCTTCIGNSGPLPEPISAAITKSDLTVCSVLSGNRNFEGRVNPQIRANYLASPMLVVAYALAGSMKVDLLKDPLGHDKKGKPVYLADLWPSNKEIADTVRRFVKASSFRKRYADVFDGDRHLAQGRDLRRPDLWVGQPFDLCAEPALFRRHARQPRRRRGCRGRAHPGVAGRQHHHRPHLARGLDQEGEPGRPVPHRPWRAAGGVQLLWRAARQSRGDDARHLRQYPPEERDAAGDRGRHHPPSPRRRDDVDL